MPPCDIFGMEKCGKRWEMVDENGMSDTWVFPKLWVFPQKNSSILRGFSLIKHPLWGTPYEMSH